MRRPFVDGDAKSMCDRCDEVLLCIARSLLEDDYAKNRVEVVVQIGKATFFMTCCEEKYISQLFLQKSVW